jgi:hypothetical protein
MNSIYTFINTDMGASNPVPPIIPKQSMQDKYGVMSANNNMYRVSSIFDLSTDNPSIPTQLTYLQRSAICMFDAKMFAQFQDGSSSNLINVVLKPVKQISANGLNVKYIVYRGILAESLVNGNNLQDISYYSSKGFDVNKTMIGKIRASPATSFDKNIIGVSRVLSLTEKLEYVFAVSETDSSSNTINHPVVSAGDAIGIFNESAKISIEIIVDDIESDITIEELKLVENIIDVTGLTGMAKKQKQEKIHNYIDPAAFFATFGSIANCRTYCKRKFS